MSTRVTGGALRGRRLQTPAGLAVRPTASRVRESLFSILGQRLDGLAVLDLCAGAGTFGIEAASRGAARVVFVERDRRHTRVLQGNARLLEGLAEHRVVAADAGAALQRLAADGERFDVVFVDAPYADGPRLVAELGPALAAVLAGGGTLLVEAARSAELPEALDELRRADRRLYGGTAVTIYCREH